MSSATTCGNRSGPSRTPFRGWPKSVRLPPGILFAFIPESCSTSTRNAVRLHPGILFALARNPHTSIEHSARPLKVVFIGCLRFSYQRLRLFDLPLCGQHSQKGCECRQDKFLCIWYAYS